MSKGRRIQSGLTAGHAEAKDQIVGTEAGRGGEMGVGASSGVTCSVHRGVT